MPSFLRYSLLVRKVLLLSVSGTAFKSYPYRPLSSSVRTCTPTASLSIYVSLSTIVSRSASLSPQLYQFSKNESPLFGMRNDNASTMHCGGLLSAYLAHGMT